jgi:YVTN family beta-propeller protein
MKLIAPLAWSFVLVVIVAPSALRATEAKEYSVLKTMSLAGEGRWDFITFDAATHRIYVPRSSHVQVLDTETGKVVEDWAGTDGVHGVALVQKKHLAFTSNGRSNDVSVFDLQTNKKIATVKAGSSPDAIVYDEASDKILVMNHRGGTITFIPVGDGQTFSPSELQVGGALECAETDGAGHAFVNVEDKNEVVQIDTTAGTVMNHWPITGGEGPTGLALDARNHRLFLGCGGNNKLAVMDSTNGAIITLLPIGERCDGCAFDPGTGDVFASCGDSTLAVAHADADGKYAIVQTVKTSPGARTIGLDPQAHHLYLPTADFEPAEPGKRPTMKNGSFKIIVVGKQ